jgi:uncharacterized protein YdeI (YjbR/CyaY-like superfamily)
MGQRSEGVDAYIAKSPDFSRPILERLRDWLHEGSPELEEAIKWGAPSFSHHGILAGMAAFKQHVGFGFWKGKLLDDPHGILADEGFGGSGNLRLESLGDLPEKEHFMVCLRQAMELNEQGVPLPRAGGGKERAPIEVPDDLEAALDASPAARATFDGLAYSHRKEYVEWITEAKREATRAKRIAQAIEWLAEGKPRNWKYM